MTHSDMLEDVVKSTLKDNKMKDTKENRLAILQSMQEGWDEDIEPSVESYIFKTSLVLAISHLSMRIRLNLN